jgi:hypothetical protein
MPWQFDAENLVYKQPPETTGYTWKPMGQNENGTNPEGEWVKNEGFDPTTLLNGRVDKYGRLDLTLREDLTPAEKRGYQLAYGSVDPNQEQFEVKSIDPNFNLKNNLEWWDVDPAYQNWWINEHSQNKGGALGTGGGLIGMRPNEYIVPAAILAGGALAAYAAPAAGALGAVGEGGAIGAAGEGALTTGEILGSSGFTPVGGASFAIEPGAAYTTGALGGGALSGGGGADIGLGTNAPLQGPTYGELGVTGVSEGGMGPTYAEMGNTGLNTEQAISAADAAAQQSQIAEALKTANQVRQGVSTAKNLAKMLSPSSGLPNSLGQLAQGQTGVASAIPAILRGNQNPFLQTAQQPIRNAQPMDLSSLANLLKQG